MFSHQLLEHLDHPISICAASCGPDAKPCFTRVFGVDLDQPARRIRVYAPEATSAPMLENLRRNPQVAVMIASWADFNAFQFKGRLVDVSPAGPEAQKRIEEIRAKIVALTTQIVSKSFGEGWGRFVTWPAVSLTIQVEETFAQTPGPGAGMRIGS